MEELNLDYNIINYIDASLLYTLHTLSLRGNHLNSIDFFYGMDQLTTLDLSSNPIQYIDSELCTSPLVNIDCESCDLEALPYLECIGNTLQRLQIKNNMITELHTSEVDGLVHLTFLDISYNTFTSLDSSSFITLVKYTHFYEMSFYSRV